jgi:hypothetical protein
MKRVIFPILILAILVISCKQNNANSNDMVHRASNMAKTQPVILTHLNNLNIHEPKTVGNLTLFIISGDEGIVGEKYLPLTKAMEQKEVVVKETGNVNELKIDNNGNSYVFIHSGDIVKGGKQDRTIAQDIIIPPKTKNIALESFCVESGRWEQREAEEVSEFAENTKMLASKDLKLASRYEKNQGKVWQKVSEITNKLNENLSSKKGYVVDVANDTSETSLQLALENKTLGKEKEKMYNAFKDLANTPNALGFAYAINGELYAVELYNNEHLFDEVWEKVLEAVVIEAIGEEDTESDTVPTTKDVADYINIVKKSDKQTSKRLNEITEFRITENKSGHLVFDTKDLTKKLWVHKSYMKRDTSIVKKEAATHQHRQLNLIGH